MCRLLLAVVSLQSFLASLDAARTLGEFFHEILDHVRNQLEPA